jgi:hypothetical protein
MKKLLIFCGVIVLILTAILYFPPTPIVSIIYRDLGDIQQARISTNWILRKYKFTKNPTEIRNWLLEYHGEAPRQEVFYTFVDWSLSNQSDFISIIGGVEPNLKSNLLQFIAIGIVDSKPVEEFHEAFKQFESQDIEELKFEVEKLRNK